MEARLRLGTRGSPLALAQARLTAAALLEEHGWAEGAVEIVPIVSSGDRIQDRPLAELGGKALWTRELDAALLDGRIDLAVHSMKDVETALHDGIGLVAMLKRADVRERLIGAETIAALPNGARIGTSSPRRTAQLKALRPDVEIVLLRGNVATRLSRVAAGEIDATLLAAAGLERLGEDVGAPIEVTEMLPACAQGAVGITVATDDAATLELVTAIDHAPTHAAVRLERAFLAALGGSCHSPVAALALIDGDEVTFCGEILREDGGEVVAGERSASGLDALLEVEALARELLGRASPALRGLFSG